MIAQVPEPKFTILNTIEENVHVIIPIQNRANNLNDTVCSAKYEVMHIRGYICWSYFADRWLSSFSETHKIGMLLIYTYKEEVFVFFDFLVISCVNLCAIKNDKMKKKLWKKVKNWARYVVLKSIIFRRYAYVVVLCVPTENSTLHFRTYGNTTIHFCTYGKYNYAFPYLRNIQLRMRTYGKLWTSKRHILLNFWLFFVIFFNSH